MSERFCVRGCTVRGVHFAACPDFGRSDGECQGCAPAEARDGVLLCDRCYGRLRRRLEDAPDLIGHLRSIADPLKAAVYDRVMVQGSSPDAAPAPVAADLLDACDDIMHVLGGRSLAPGASSDGAYRQALMAVQFILAGFDSLANDGAAITEWWRLVMSSELEDHPEFWTITRALSRWPLEDRSTWARQPCPECGMRTVKITPPKHRHARTWFACSSCRWAKTEKDDDGLWAAAFGQYAESRHDEGNSMATKSKTTKTRDIDITAAVAAGVQHIIDHAEQVEKIGAYGAPTAAVIGAAPALAEQFALMADDMAADLRANYENGILIAGGARLVAAAIRASVQGGELLDVLLASMAEGDIPADAEPEQAAA